MKESQKDQQKIKIEEILASFELFDSKYKREQVEAALEQKQEITPYLITILEQVRDNPQKYVENEDYFAHVYALMLLAHFQEHQAHQVIIDLFSLPEPIPESLFGDTITEDLPVILLRTCNGSLEGIKSLIFQKNADQFCRGSALKAITYAVIEELISREEALSFLGSLLTGDEAEPDSVFYGELACCIYDLYPKDLMDKVREAYKNKLIPSFYIDWNSFHVALRKGQEKCLAQLREKVARRAFDDIHESMSWWACFHPENSGLFSSSQTVDNISLPLTPKSLQQEMAQKSHRKKAKKKKRGFGKT
jgi:hypothetical protein